MKIFNIFKNALEQFIPNRPSKHVITSTDWIFLISFVLSLGCFSFFFPFELETTEGWFFLRVHVYIWAVAGHKLKTLSIWAQSFNTWFILPIFFPILQILDDLFSYMVKQISNSLTVYDNSLILTFDKRTAYMWSVLHMMNVITNCLILPYKKVTLTDHKFSCIFFCPNFHDCYILRH